MDDGNYEDDIYEAPPSEKPQEELLPTSTIQPILEETKEPLPQEKILLSVLRYCTSEKIDPSDEHSAEVESFWSHLFDEHFYSAEVLDSNKVQHQDDCLYFVRKMSSISPQTTKKLVKGSSEDEASKRFFVRRKDAKGLLPPKGDTSIQWQETFFLNVLLHKYEYSLESSVRRKYVNPQTKRQTLKVIKKKGRRVWALPNKIRMDIREKVEEIEYTYPLLYFAIDDFSEAWKDISLGSEGEMICVELFAEGCFFSKGKTKARLFAGALDYDVIRKEYNNKRSMFSPQNLQAFFNLKGPKGKGAAEMAVHAQQDEASTPSRLGGMFRRLSFSEPENQNLNCYLTQMNLSWDVIMADILTSSKRLMEDRLGTSQKR